MSRRGPVRRALVAAVLAVGIDALIGAATAQRAQKFVFRGSFPVEE